MIRGQNSTASRGARLAVIDGLRLLAALIVACYHYMGTTASVTVWGAPPEELFPDVQPAASYGWLGVEMFFIISGFVICMSSWGRTSGDFFRSRVTRLFPAYWPAVLITAAVLTLWPATRAAPDWHDVLVNMTMLNGPMNVAPVDNVYWTLWVEARFYLLFAVIMLWRGGMTRTRVMLFGYAWLFAGLLSASANDKLLRSLFQPDYAPYFVGGIAIYLIHRFGSRIELWGLAGFSYVLMMISVTNRTLSMRAFPDELSPPVSMLLITAFFAVLIAVALGWTNRIRWRWLTPAGALTYPFYLLHFAVGWVVLHALRGLLPPYVAVGSTIALMLTASWLLHRLVERPLARVLKNALVAASSAARDAPAPPPSPLPPSTRTAASDRVDDRRPVAAGPVG